MKRIVLLLTLVSLVGLREQAAAQANYMGSVIIDPYYGFPNFGKQFATSFESSSTSGLKVGGVGPMGLRAEYMLSDKFGLGVDFIYNSYNLDYRNTQTDSIYDGNTDTWSTNTTVTDNAFKMQRVRVQARFNFHFDVNNPALDAYFGVAAGTNQRYRKAYENGVEVTDNASLGNLTLLPFSVRICTGMRYYFSPNFGLNAELGLGGPLLSAGLSVRF